MFDHFFLKILKVIFALLASLSLSVQSQPSNFPSKNIELIVPWGPGGGADVMGRLVARWLETDIKSSVVVQNIPGATGTIGLQRLVNIGADGHAIGVLTGDTLTMAAFPQSPFKLSETVALGVMIRQPSGLFAKFDGPYKSWNDVIAAAKKKPINVAITGPNSPDEVTVNYLASKGINLVNIPYPKPAERFLSVLGGHVELLYEQAGDVKTHLEAKSLRPLIFFASKRLSAPFADVPVSSDFGYDILLPQTRSIIAKANVDPKRLEIISNSLEKFANTPEFANYLKDQYAAPDSFIPMRNAQKFLENEILSFQKINDSLPKSR